MEKGEGNAPAALKGEGRNTPLPPSFFPLPISAIVLDLDGTLLHSAPELAEAANRMLRDLGRPAASQELLMSYIGNGISWLVKRALTGDMHAEPDAALFDKAMPFFDTHYKALLSHSKPYPGVMEGLKAMQDAGFKLGCITNKSARYTDPLLQSSGLAPYFSIVVSGDTLPEKKPHPLPLLHCARFFGVPVAGMLMIGDSLNDTLAARAAGCPVFCVPYGYNHGKPVDGLDVDAVIADLSAALKLIKRI
jgi:phosphoglycolate phosphatase